MSKKMGRPLIEIEKDKFEKLCEILATAEDIAHLFDCHVDTIERWCKRTYDETFAQVYKRFAAEGKSSLRRKQFEVAMKGKGNVTMLIWLGKQILGQRDMPYESTTADIPAPIYSISPKVTA